MKLNELLAELGATLGIEGVELDDNGLCCLRIDSEILIYVEEVTERHAAILYSPVGVLPEEKKEALFERLLGAQLFGREIGEGCSFGLLDESGEILLNRVLSLDKLDGSGFYEAVNQMANWADYWTKRLGEDASEEREQGPLPGTETDHLIPI